MKKLALFAMLLCSCMMYGCTKPEGQPAGEGTTTEGTTEGETTTTGDTTEAGGGGEATE